MTTVTNYAQDEVALVALGERLGLITGGRGVIFLRGELGAGKTTFCRGVLRAFGHRGAVKSPTYTLVEPYEFPDKTVYHFDLYRLGHPEELEYLGIRDYLDGDSLCLIEWPERGMTALVAPDIEVAIGVAGQGRELRLSAGSARGEDLLRRWSAEDDNMHQREQKQ